MSYAPGLSALAALVVAILVLAGAALALIGSIGLLRLQTFYDRVHAPTMGTTLGMGLVLVASMLLFSALGTRPVVHELLITFFMVVTTPVTFIVLLRAALHRSRPNDGAEAAGAPPERPER